MGHWEERDHTADLALHVWGEDLPDLFAAAAKGMASLLVDLAQVPTTQRESVVLAAPDVETLLVDWLNELLYLGEMGETLSAYVAFEFQVLTPTSLEAVIYGGPVAGYREGIKAATFHNLAVRRTAEGYETEIVFDT